MYRIADSMQQQNEINDEWRKTFLINHESTAGLINSASEIAGEERQMQIALLQQILTAVSANGGVRHGSKAISYMLELPPG